MKIILLILFTLGAVLPSLSQTRDIPTTRVTNLWLKELFCFDSSGNKNKSCSLGLNGFEVKFSKASIDKKTGKLELEGRLSPPMPKVGIYLSDSDKVQLNKAITFTSYDPVEIHNDGYFTISFVLKPKQALYFYHPAFFVRQYDIYELIDKKK